MADPQNIFGTAQPMASPEFVNDERRRELMEPELDRVDSNYDTRMGQVSSGATNVYEANHQRNRETQQAQQRVQQQMQNKSPEQQQAELGAATNKAVAAMGGLSSVPEAQREEEVLKIAAREAQKLGMQGMAGQLASKYADLAQNRIKKELEMEKLEATTSSAKTKARVDDIESQSAGQQQREEVDYETGNKEEFTIGADGKEVPGSRRVVEYPTFTPTKLGKGPDGQENIVLQNSGNGTMVDPPKRTGETVKAALKRMDDANLAFKDADKELAKVGPLLSGKLINWWTTGAYGTRIADFGAVRGIPGGEDAANLKTQLNSIKAVLGFDALKALREKGSTLGQVAVIELQMLQSAVANIDQTASPEGLKENLRRVQEHYSNYKKNVLYQTKNDVNYMFNGPYAKEYAKYTFKDRTGRRGIIDPTTGQKRWVD